MAGQIGFDEGGVLQAVSEPIGTTTITSYEYNKKGLVERQQVTTFKVSVADVLAVLIAMGFFKIGTKYYEDAKSGKLGPNIFYLWELINKVK